MKTKASTKEEYLRRITRVVDYIANHLDEEMDLKKLADISHFSEFHFHRIFKAFRHETLAAYVTRTCVETTVLMLRYSDLPVETIAGNVGYELPSSLSKSFKQFYGVSPTAYRNNKNHIVMKQTENTPGLKLKAPRIVELLHLVARTYYNR